MVLLAASICTKNGRALLSRQFVEMTKARIEGLIATFPKLISEGKQHTFVETESVRYVYQPLEKLFVLLITTKASNILEDLETLRLFARVIPEYACGTDEESILANAFQLIFAFDEIVALGYREDVNINQIRSFTEMDSHDERVFRAVQESKEREAKEVMKQRARDLQIARQEAAKRGGGTGMLGSGGGGGRAYASPFTGFGSDGNKPDEPRVVSARDRPFDNLPSERPSKGGKQHAMPTMHSGGGMKLGGGSGHDGLESFVDRLRSEGVAVTAGGGGGGGVDHSKLREDSSKGLETGGRQPASNVKREDLHFRIEEKLVIQATRDGGVECFELQGVLHTLAHSEAATGARVLVDTTRATRPEHEHQPTAQMQTHPNLDKKVFQSSDWLEVKRGGKPFPEDQEVGVLRWRLQTQEESILPLSINCWPNPIAGGFEVNIEYELTNTKFQFYQVVVNIPLPSGSKAPVIGNCDGEYNTAHRGNLEWQLPEINASNPSGSIEFTVSADSSSTVDTFFPLSVALHADRSFFDITVKEATDAEGKPMLFSSETHLHADKYEIV